MYYTEEFSLDYKTLDELSYWDTQEKYIRLYKNGSLQGYLYVYKVVEFEGNWEHSVKQLEEIVETQKEQLRKIQLAMQSYQEWLNHYGGHHLKTQRQAWELLKEKINLKLWNTKN